MGIVAFNWAEGNNNQLTLLMNRDNWVHRDISGASWNGNGQILSGRSADNDGTWFGISRGGRVAFLVSAEILLDHFDPFFASELYPIKFLEGNMTPQAFGNYVAQRGEVGQLLSFSLIVADMTLNSMIHIRKPEQAESNVMIQPVPFGVHTLSPYDGLDSIEPWDLLVFDVFNQMTAELGNNPLPPPKEIAGIMYDDAEEEDAVFLKMFAHPRVRNLI
ncbi:Transport and Golgi organization protein 2 [Arabidopsis thaliana x Arabidopsis arenosa]|uniref:Transport and Golgi organization protein 2 n=1 Tax=Arabidopsis thaliana x Arabidopsis arenosa TaxID=1240361 RepID=A0A8T2BXA4_9BRAS|nr:Transport and Golgi organization protein 2 [Arabidopsis thaliana x Arabidopsis arenosa]